MGLIYSIVSKMESGFINYELESQLAIMKQQGLIDEINIEFKGKYFFYELKLSDNTFMPLEYCINSLILMLTNLIIDKYQNIIIEKNIKNYYFFLDKNERKTVSNKTVKYLLTINNMNNQKIWKSIISKKITRHFKHHNNLIIDGFVNFRLKDFCNEIQLAVEDTVVDYILEKEYDEFLNFLKHLVHITSSKFKSIHIFFYETGSFKLYSDDMKVIEPYNNGVNLLDDSINFDTVISSLISFAPKELFLHGSEKLKYNKVIDTLEKIFGRKNVIKCSGCIKCLPLLKK